MARERRMASLVTTELCLLTSAQKGCKRKAI